MGSFGLSNSGNDVMKKDFDGASWAKNHNIEFQQLIAKARKKKALSHLPQESKKGIEGIDTTTWATGGHAVVVDDDQNRTEPIVGTDPTGRDFVVLGEEMERRDATQNTASTGGGTSLIEADSEISARPDDAP
jgi:hypothetical protein